MRWVEYVSEVYFTAVLGLGLPLAVPSASVVADVLPARRTWYAGCIRTALCTGRELNRNRKAERANREGQAIGKGKSTMYQRTREGKSRRSCSPQSFVRINAERIPSSEQAN
jgi:hypothetical protein